MRYSTKLNTTSASPPPKFLRCYECPPVDTRMDRKTKLPVQKFPTMKMTEWIPTDGIDPHMKQYECENGHLKYDVGAMPKSMTQMELDI